MFLIMFAVRKNGKLIKNKKFEIKSCKEKLGKFTINFKGKFYILNYEVVFARRLEAYF